MLAIIPAFTSGYVSLEAGFSKFLSYSPFLELNCDILKLQYQLQGVIDTAKLPVLTQWSNKLWNVISYVECITNVKTF